MVQRQPTMSTLTSIPPGTYDVRPQRGFSSTLMESIALSKAKFEAWVQHEKAKIVKESEEYAKQLAIEQSTVDSKAANLLALQLERGLKVSEEGDGKDSAESIAARKKSLEDQRLALQSDIEKLQGERDTREKRVSVIASEEQQKRLQAEKVRKTKEAIEEARKTTVDDLTNGIVFYKYLGLDFERTQVENQLSFCFSQLDPEAPTRKFSFILNVDDQDRYQISNCQPPLEATALAEIESAINETDDMSYLVRKMRALFSKSIGIEGN